VTPLARRIAGEIAAHGPISVARFMELALTAPELGYYMTRDPFGAEGDFTTAPEISQMFGEMIGLWAVVTWESMGRPEPFVLAELGPGRGTLMADALRAARLRPEFLAAARIALVEASPALRARQKTTLAGHAPEWFAAFDELPGGPMILIANEFFDALPIRQFVRSQGVWRERRVGAAGEGFRFVAGDAAKDEALPADAPEGAIAERGVAGERLAAAIGARVAQNGGAALIVDYGHGASAVGATLQAVRAHDYADPLADPGSADITAHVDFGAIARAARAAGAAVHGPVGQGWFLAALGIARRAERLAADKDAKAREVIELALKRLIAPSEMGNLFKAMVVADARLGVPAGFEPSAA
jgi:SAM-dependent MidA family methyltransferase